MTDLTPRGDPIHDADADRPLGLDAGQAKKAMETINKTLSQLSFLRDVVATGKATLSDAHVHLGLLRHSLSDLAGALGAGDWLDGKLERAMADLRAANGEIRRLQGQLGGTVSGDAVAAGLRRFEDLFRAWYLLAGFHYAHMEYSPWGFTARFSDEVEAGDRAGRAEKLADDPVAARYAGAVPYAFRETDWDLHGDGLRLYLLDTDRNKRNLEALFASAFPGCRVAEYRSRQERYKYLLECTVFVSYEQVDAWRERAGGGDGET